MSGIIGVADRALARLAAVLADPEDAGGFDECSVDDVMGQLSAQDRRVISNIVRRVAELEESQGAAAAEAALGDVIGLLLGGRRTASC